MIDESSDYYIGMAETAISYIKYNIQQTDNNLTICHKRIKNDEMSNPMNLVVDHRERDISEYLKYIFINQENNLNTINRILNNYNYTKDERIKDKILNNQTFREYKHQEAELNLLILEINSKLKEITKKDKCGL